MTISNASRTVAIAMPVYNGARHLEEVLTSIQNQTYQDFTCFICDNKSTDATKEIAKRFSDNSNKFVYVYKDTFVDAMENSMRAYQLADNGSRYFVFMHDDNVYSVTFLEKMVRYMDAHPECSLCGFFLHYVNHENGKITASHHTPIPVLLKRSKLLYLAFEWRSVINTFVMHFFMRRSAVDNIDFALDIDDFPERYLIAQLRGLGKFHVIEEDLAKFYSFGIGECRGESWVESRSLMKFGEKELAVLLGFKQLKLLEKVIIAQKYTYVTLRHKVPGTAWRWWLWPAYFASFLAEFIRPNKWRYQNGKIMKR